MADWSTRIPEAIEEGKKRLGRGTLVRRAGGGPETAITAGEAALAEALWETHRKYCDEYNWDYDEPPPALIAFTEKIEHES